MAFSDDFTGSDGDWLDERSGWSGSTSGAGSKIYSNALAAANANANYYWCTDQGSADNYTQARIKVFGVDHRESFLATRLVDEANFLGVKIHGTGTEGLRLTKVIAGTQTDLIKVQGALNQWVKVEVTGSTAELFTGGTGATPSWTSQGTATYSENTTETSQGFAIENAEGTTTWMDDFEAGALGGTASIIPQIMHHRRMMQ
ncbi:MAG: hypothetical protein GY746_07855 [Gammaproteobacteria bacterium]|nr:hypothetical protein [Gammaproteobacteria bacterium]